MGCLNLVRWWECQCQLQWIKWVGCQCPCLCNFNRIRWEECHCLLQWIKWEECQCQIQVLIDNNLKLLSQRLILYNRTSKCQLLLKHKACLKLTKEYLEMQESKKINHLLNKWWVSLNRRLSRRNKIKSSMTMGMNTEIMEMNKAIKIINTATLTKTNSRTSWVKIHRWYRCSLRFSTTQLCNSNLANQIYQWFLIWHSNLQTTQMVLMSS